MKIKGKKLEGANEITIVIPRYNTDDIVFKAVAILDFSDLNNIIKEPEAPKILRKGTQVEDLTDKGYISKRTKARVARYNYMMFTSLLATEGLEWETVDINKPDTWENWEKELRDSGLTNSEVMYITDKIEQVNSLNQDKLDEARDHFLLMQSVLNE